MPRRLIKYTLVVSRSEPDLVTKVNNKIADGWEPLGGVGLVENLGRIRGVRETKLAQAMVWYEYDK